MCLRRSSAYVIDHSLSEDNDEEFLVGELYELKHLSTIRGVVHAV